MKHKKTYHSKVLKTAMGSITIEGPLTSESLDRYSFHDQLDAFRVASKQFEALKKISCMPEGRIIIARRCDIIIGYVTFVYPDPMERWYTEQLEELLVLGAIEVVPAYRGAKIASELIIVSMMDVNMENYITISNEYYWHWDLEGTDLDIWSYRKVMEKMMAKGGLYPAATDDPEIISHPANCLMVRIGKNVPEASIQQFDRLRFFRKYNGKNMREGY